MYRYLPDGYVDYCTYNLREIVEFFRGTLDFVLEFLP